MVSAHPLGHLLAGDGYPEKPSVRRVYRDPPTSGKRGLFLVHATTNTEDPNNVSVDVTVSRVSNGRTTVKVRKHCQRCIAHKLASSA